MANERQITLPINVRFVLLIVRRDIYEIIYDKVTGVAMEELCEWPSNE